MQAKLFDFPKITTIENGGLINRRNVLCGSVLKKLRSAKARFFLCMSKRAESISAWSEKPAGPTRKPWNKIPLILVLVLVISAPLFVSARALADITQLLGQDANSNIVNDFAHQMGCAQRGNYFKCMNTGVEFKIDTSWLKVTSLWLYAGGVDGYSAFKGKIPLGLEWGMTPQQVEAILGPSPDRIHYRFSNLPFKVELSYYTAPPRLGRVLLTMREY